MVKLNWKNPEEEYFRLTCLAIKIKLSNEDPEFDTDISADQLYLLCKKGTVPFHNWYEWITAAFEAHDQASARHLLTDDEEESEDISVPEISSTEAPANIQTSTTFAT